MKCLIKSTIPALFIALLYANAFGAIKVVHLNCVEYHFDHGRKISILKGDITEQNVDAIVNPANSNLAHGGGLARVISQKAGSELQNDCNKLPNKPSVGNAITTDSYNLKPNIKRIIHTVGPDCRDASENNNRKTLLENAYKAVFEQAQNNNCTSIAIPAISIGIFDYPLEEAAAITANTVYSCFIDNKQLKDICIVLFNSDKSQESIIFDEYVNKFDIKNKLNNCNQGLKRVEQKVNPPISVPWRKIAGYTLCLFAAYKFLTSSYNPIVVEWQ